jgi:hypothetical protein
VELYLAAILAILLKLEFGHAALAFTHIDFIPLGDIVLAFADCADHSD